LHGALKKNSEIRHAYSHFKLELTVFRIAAVPAGIVSESSAHRWCSDMELESLPLHGAHRKAYNKHKGDN
jgi:A/G-specific adenine glycosylase